MYQRSVDYWCDVQQNFEAQDSLEDKEISQVAEISGGVLLRMPHMVAVEGTRPLLACILVEILVTDRLKNYPQCNLNVLIQLRTLNCALGYSLTTAQRHTCSENHPSHRVTTQREPGTRTCTDFYCKKSPNIRLQNPFSFDISNLSQSTPFLRVRDF